MIKQETIIFHEELEKMFQESKFDLLIARCREIIKKNFIPKGHDIIDNHDTAIVIGLSAGYLIDAGKRVKNLEVIRLGITVFENNYKWLQKFTSQPHLEYNIGNGKTGIFDIQRTDPTFRYTLASTKLLTEIKNHYWKAYKLTKTEERRKWPELLVNLGQSLSTSGRVIEAIQFYDMVLRDFPSHPNANVSRAYDLIWLNQNSGSYSVNQLWQASENLRMAAKQPSAMPQDKEKWLKEAQILENKLQEHGYTSSQIAHDYALTSEEKKEHSEYRIWCLKHFLTLSEHAIYCDCIGARRDDLSIVMSSRSITGEFIEQMEHALNRFKSEFGWARLQLYQSELNSWHTYDNEVTFSELFEDEVIGMRSEMLRTSMRIAFSILDKIANSLCELFDVARKEDNVSFFRFWRPKDPRWEKIKTMENPGLIGLHSIATDLHQRSGGEWGIYKEWRDLLEHRLLSLTTSDEPIDMLKVYEGDRVAVSVPYKEFRFNNLRLLQLVRSAIFMFVYCVRNKAFAEEDSSTPKMTMIMHRKHELTYS